MATSSETLLTSPDPQSIDSITPPPGTPPRIPPPPGVGGPLLDRSGEVRWSRSYDSGRELWKRPGPFSGKYEDPARGVQRIAHEQALRLLRQAARDLHRWLDAERRPELILMKSPGPAQKTPDHEFRTTGIEGENAPVGRVGTVLPAVTQAQRAGARMQHGRRPDGHGETKDCLV